VSRILGRLDPQISSNLSAQIPQLKPVSGLE
jgi:hypothetical protein